MVKILVTGAAGFIGYHVAKRLLEQNHVVVGLDNLNPYYNPALKTARLEQLKPFSNFKFYARDLADRKGLEELFDAEKIERVIHLGAQAGVRYSLENPHAYVEGNLVGFVNILEGCRKHKIDHLVYASSSSVYGLNSALPFSVEQNVDHPISLYAATKKSNELLAHAYSHLYRIPTTGLRFFTVYGPWGRPDMAVFLFTKAILNGKPIKLFNRGEMQRDFTYIDDVVEGVLRIADQPAKPDSSWNSLTPDPSRSSAPYRIYNIGNQNPVSLREFVETLEKALGKKAKIELTDQHAGDVSATAADVEALRKAIGYAPKTTLEEGLKKFVTWFLEHSELCSNC